MYRFLGFVLFVALIVGAIYGCDRLPMPTDTVWYPVAVGYDKSEGTGDLYGAVALAPTADKESCVKAWEQGKRDYNVELAILDTAPGLDWGWACMTRRQLLHDVQVYRCVEMQGIRGRLAVYDCKGRAVFPITADESIR